GRALFHRLEPAFRFSLVLLQSPINQHALRSLSGVQVLFVTQCLPSLHGGRSSSVRMLLNLAGAWWKFSAGRRVLSLWSVLRHRTLLSPLLPPPYSGRDFHFCLVHRLGPRLYGRQLLGPAPYGSCAGFFLGPAEVFRRLWNDPHLV